MIGEPHDRAGAQDLADRRPVPVPVVGARAWSAPGRWKKKKGADNGIDGRLYFHRHRRQDQADHHLREGRHVNAAHVRDLRGVIEREKAAIGVLITMEEPTKPDAERGRRSRILQTDRPPTDTYPRIQILTIDELLMGESRCASTRCSTPPSRRPPKQREHRRNS